MSDTFDLSRERAGALENKILTFEIGGQLYGIELAFATEIISMQAITKIPHLPPYVKGIINLRGKVIPVMNVRARFSKEEIPYDDRTCIIVAVANGLSVGLIVDAVAEVISVTQQEISSAPDYKLVNTNHYISYIVTAGGGIKLILDVRRLIDDESGTASLMGADADMAI